MPSAYATAYENDASDVLLCGCKTVRGTSVVTSRGIAAVVGGRQRACMSAYKRVTGTVCPYANLPTVFTIAVVVKLSWQRVEAAEQR